MAITKVRRTEDWSGSLNKAGKANYTVAFLVETDSEDHGVQDIADADDGTLRVPEKGAEYEYGNDLDGLAVASNYTVKRIDKFLWHVTVKYEPLKAKQDKMTEDGEPTDDWRLEGPTIEVRPIQMSRPAEFGAYIGILRLQHLQNQPPQIKAFDTGHPAKFDNTGPATQLTAQPGGIHLAGGIANSIPITNSAWVQFDPPPEADYSRLGITITRNHSVFPTVLMGKYQDVVNSDNFLINLNGFVLRVPKFAAKMQSISGSREYADESPFWRVRYELHLDLFRGWRVDLLDRGFVTTKENSDSEVAQSPGDFPTETSVNVHNIIDDKGLPMNTPVMLDGQGNQLPSAGTPSYLRYAIYQERPFTPLLFDRPGPILVMPE